MIARNSLFGPVDPAPNAGHAEPPPRVGFFDHLPVPVTLNDWGIVVLPTQEKLPQCPQQTIFRVKRQVHGFQRDP